jgi:hypothetical protein
MIEGNVFTSVKNLNALPALNGVSKTLSPAALITGKSNLDFNNLLKIKYGDYAQVFTETKNDMSERTVSAIAIYPTRNVQASWYFLSLTTGKQITGYQWMVLPITADVITRVHDLAAAQNQERIDDAGNLHFQWCPDQGTMTFHDVPDVDYVPDSDLLASESSFDETVDNDLPFSDIPPEVGTNIQNTAPVNITPNIPIDTMDPIHASIEHQKIVHFKEREDIIHSKERESEIGSGNDHIESLT